MTDAGRPVADQRLVDLAVAAIRDRLETGTARLPEVATLPDDLRAPGASFVTLERGGRLLGCIGSVDARRPLGVDVAANAVGAAVRDPRFPPLGPADFAAMDVTVAVLSPLEPLDVAGIEQLAAALHPGRDGVLVTSGGHRATFLPHVWATLPEPTTFLDRLWRKAGLRPRDWPDDLAVGTYTASTCTDAGPRPPLRRAS